MKVAEVREMLTTQFIVMRRNPTEKNKRQSALLLKAASILINLIKVETK